MYLKNIGSNMTLLTTASGDEYFFSYETLVAGFDRTSISPTENGYWYVSESYSSTTTRHINKYLENLKTSPKTTKVGKSDARGTQATMM